MSTNVKLMKQINNLIEAIRREDPQSTMKIPDYTSINTMNTEALIKLRTHLIHYLARIAPSYPVKDLKLGNLQEIRSSSYATYNPMSEMSLKEIE